MTVINKFWSILAKNNREDILYYIFFKFIYLSSNNADIAFTNYYKKERDAHNHIKSLSEKKLTFAKCHHKRFYVGLKNFFEKKLKLNFFYKLLLFRKIIKITKLFPSNTRPSIIKFLTLYSNLCEQYQIYGAPKSFLCVADLSSERLAMAYATKKFGGNIIYYFYTDYSKQIPPFPVNAAILRNRAQAELFKTSYNKNTLIFLLNDKDEIELKPIDTRVKNIGIAVNNFYNKKDLKKVIISLSKKYPQTFLNIRHHPNDKEKYVPKIKSAKIFTNSLSLKEFAEINDFIVTGNSSVQMDFLREGCPVILTKLDDLGNDLLGYAKKKIVYSQTHIERMNIENVNKFYRGNWRTRFEEDFLFNDSQFLHEDELSAFLKNLS
ncbi:MAG: hypothetical protein CMH28_02515 [Micavibrio sp.]|nr:hypothetical protein [Micavibrio sp.]